MVVRYRGGVLTSPSRARLSASRPSRARPIAAVLLLLYAAAVLVVVMWPSPVDEKARGMLARILKGLHDRHLLEFLGYPQVEFLSNIALFIPLGVLLGLLLGRRIWGLAVLVCFAGSVAIELTQYVFLPARFATVDDVIANTLGALAGALVAGALLARWRRRREQRLRRRAVALPPPPPRDAWAPGTLQL